MNRTRIILLLLILQSAIVQELEAQKIIAALSSPRKKIELTVLLDGSGIPWYVVRYAGDTVLRPSQLGIERNDAGFSKGLTLVSVSPVQYVKDSYVMMSAKRKNCSYKANKKTVHFRNAGHQLMDIIFQLSDDGLAFRYFFPGTDAGIKTVEEELTSLHFPLNTKAWLQPMQTSKSGWEATNPAYEEHYVQNMDAGTVSPSKAGWVYPALFCHQDTWMLITESSLDSNYCASRLLADAPDAEYRLGFPDPREVFPGGGILPQGRLPFSTPWRLIAIGSLKTIAESTLGTDLSKPAIRMNTSFIKPGKASWSWINSKDDSIVYSEQKRYIDFAADMHWQYCLIDAAWDQKIGYEKVKELAAYAAGKKVGLLLWYNSAGDWNTVKYTPKGKLLTHESRIKEFARLKEMGIKGVKIDFFGGDGQSVMRYYIDILHDAAAQGLMVNFHGATLPRGWQRTYPHLMTVEAIRGFEMITFNQSDANLEPTHCTMLPFTRNAFDPMDFTPMNLYKIQTRVKRKTTGGFELALSVLFLSGIQHYAESPEGMRHVPEYVQQFLRTLPDSWEEVKFLEGFPGKYVVMARRYGNRWYLAGINGENNNRSVMLDLSSFKKKKATMITDGKEPLSFAEESVDATMKKQIDMQPNGGFVLVLE